MKSGCRLVLALALGAAGVASAQSPLATYEGPDRLERIVAEARKEGSLTLYTTIAEKDLPTLIKPFEAKYGVKVNVWRAGTDKVLQRTLAEAAAKRHEVDAVHFGSPEMEALSREKVLQPVASPVYKDLQPGSVPPHREWAATLLSVWVQAYNTSLIKKEELPRTYQDLLDPKWKGKLGIEADDAVWFGALANVMGEEKAVKLFRDMVRANGLSVRKGHTLLANLVVSGEVPYALTLYHYKAEQLKNAGAPLDWYLLPPGFARFLGTGIMRRAPHPHAAVLFLDFMLSDAQRVLLDRDFTPTNMKVKPLDVAFNVIDPAQILDQGDKWQKLYDEIVIRQR